MNLKSRFFAELQACIDAQADLLLDGRCPDMTTYAKSCGIIYGLKMAMQEFDGVLSASSEVTNELEEMP